MDFDPALLRAFIAIKETVQLHRPQRLLARTKAAGRGDDLTRYAAERGAANSARPGQTCTTMADPPGCANWVHSLPCVGSHPLHRHAVIHLSPRSRVAPCIVLGRPASGIRTQRWAPRPGLRRQNQLSYHRWVIWNSKCLRRPGWARIADGRSWQATPCATRSRARAVDRGPADALFPPRA